MCEYEYRGVHPSCGDWWSVYDAPLISTGAFWERLQPCAACLSTCSCTGFALESCTKFPFWAWEVFCCCFFLNRVCPTALSDFFFSFFNEVFYTPVLQVRHQVMKWFWSMDKPGNILGIFGPMIMNRCGVVLGALLFLRNFGRTAWHRKCTVIKFNL